MFNYIKWELKSVLAEKKVMLITILVTFILEFLILKMKVTDSFLGGIITFVFSIILIVCALNSFFAGAKRTMDTYNKQTFLLESMIPISSGKLVLAKYLIAIIMNFFYIFAFIVGVYMIIFIAFEDVGIVQILMDAMGEVIEENIGSFIRILVYSFLTSVGYTTFVTTVFCFLKSYFPNAKKLTGIAIVVGYIGFLIISNLFLSMLGDVKNWDLVMDFIFIVTTIAGYFATTYLIENKMEIYN